MKTGPKWGTLELDTSKAGYVFGEFSSRYRKAGLWAAPYTHRWTDEDLQEYDPSLVSTRPSYQIRTIPQFAIADLGQSDYEELLARLPRTAEGYIRLHESDFEQILRGIGHPTTRRANGLTAEGRDMLERYLCSMPPNVARAFGIPSPDPLCSVHLLFLLPPDMLGWVLEMLKNGVPPIIPSWCSGRVALMNLGARNACLGADRLGLQNLGTPLRKAIAGMFYSSNLEALGWSCGWPVKIHPDWMKLYGTVCADLLLDTRLRDLSPVAQRTVVAAKMRRTLPFCLLMNDLSIRYCRVMNESIAGDGTWVEFDVAWCSPDGTLEDSPPVLRFSTHFSTEEEEEEEEEEGEEEEEEDALEPRRS
jgi:hypothetical protein